MINKALFTLLIVFLMITPLYSESMTLTTYYPAPFGAYDRIQLVPRTSLTGSCNTGSLYVEQTTGDVIYCQIDGTWGYLPGTWKQISDNVILSDAAVNSNLRVGIGTTNPGTQLHVSSSTLDPTVRIEKTGGGSTYNISSNQFATVMGTSSATNLEVQTNGATQLYVGSDGNVGVGTTSPGSKLEVNGGLDVQGNAGDSQMRFVNDSAWYSMGIDSSDSNNFKINFGNSVGVSDQIVVTPTGDLIVYGKILVKIGSDPLAEIKLKYISDGANSGYYAMYAP